MAARQFRNLLILLGMLLMLLSCKEAPEADITGEFGNGSGGSAVSGVTTEKTITKSDGSVIATYQYDAAFFVELPTALYDANLYFMVLTDIAAEGLSVSLTRIFGRPDTACRYQAALLARDANYTIDLTGERENDQGIAFYQVEVHKGSDYIGLYCAELVDDIGVSINVRGSSKQMLSYQQIYFILNSVSR